MLNKISSNIDFKLEGLRGVCALTVCYAHLFTFDFFGSKSLPYSSILEKLHFAHVAVLVFFILSGYVMGITYRNTELTIETSKKYLKKRFIRLYPIYILALIISFVQIPLDKQGELQIAGNLFFLQGISVQSPETNVVLWSLSYEVLYYILFIPLLKIRRDGLFLIRFMLILFLITLSINVKVPVLTSLLIGWIFWLTGLFLAWQTKSSSTGQGKSFKTLTSYFFIILTTYTLNTGSFILNLVHLPLINKVEVGFADYFFWPICTLIIAEVTNRKVQYHRLLKIISFGIPIVHLLTLIYFKHNLFTNQFWSLGVIFLSLSFIFLVKKTDIHKLGKASSLGKISYALYVLHFPIAFLLNNYLGHFFANTTLFLVGTFTWISLTLMLSYTVEILIQPKFKFFFAEKTK